MNPREFCREPGYERAVLFTYEFDAIFFERIVLHDLLAGGVTDIQVIADLGRISEVQDRWVGQVRNLGKRYRLNFATLAGAFHPKILLKTGASGAIVWIGSGNITYGGWQSNLEVGTVWRVGPDLQDRGSWLHDVLQELARWIPSDPAGSALERARAASWLFAPNDESPAPPVLISQERISLGSQLVDRWAGRGFDKVTIATGSTDEGGALLDFFHKRFNISGASILLNPESASFNAAKLSTLPISIEFVKPVDNRRVHAKCYWFTGPDGPAALIGSANCSRAAWLLAPREGGNIESIVVYDRPAEAAFESFLGRFSAEQTLPAELEPQGKPTDPDPGEVPPYPVAEVSWEQTRGELTITFTIAPPPQAVITADLCRIENACRSTSDGRVWIALPDPALLMSRLSLTGSVTIATDLEQSKQRFWVNDLRELRESAEGKRFTEPITGLKYARTNSEQQKIVNALQALANMILTDHPAFMSKPRGSAGQAKAGVGDTKDSAVTATDPDVLIRSLDDVMNSPNWQQTAYSLSGISLTGVIRAFFEFSDEQVDLTPLTEPENEPTETKKVDHPPVKPPLPPAPAPPKAAREKLHKQLDEFMKRLRGDDFAEACTVDQLIQAATYPLGIAVYGIEGGWFETIEAQEIVRTILDILFWRAYPNKGVGLFATVRQRYDELGTAAQFGETIGDGTLWAAMLAAIWKTPWVGINAGIQKSLAMRAILRCQDLLSTASVGRLATLLRGLGPMFTPDAVLDQSIAVNTILTKLEQYIVANWGRLKSEQGKVLPRVREGDVHYHPTAGWVFTVRQSANPPKSGFIVYRQNQAGSIIVTNYFYLNLSQLSEREDFIAQWLQEADKLAT